LAGLGPALQRHLLTEQKSTISPHYKLAVKSNKGELILWIDQKSFLIKRAEYSHEFLVPEMTHSPDISDVSLVAEFTDARINEEIGANLFSLEVPKDAKIVRFFVPPPQRLPSDMFGKKPDSFSFRKMDGGRLTQTELTGKIAVLVWFKDYLACEKTLQAVQQVRENLPTAEANTMAVYAVCTEPTQWSDQQIVDIVKRWNVTLTVVRDLDAVGRDLFHFEGVPTLVVLDRVAWCKWWSLAEIPIWRTNCRVSWHRWAKGSRSPNGCSTSSNRTKSNTSGS